MKTLILVPINLKRGKESDHPDIKVGRTEYLAKIGGHFYAGSFSRVWFGLHFDGWGPGGIQFDTPGTNSSSWQGLWEITKEK